MASGSVEDIVAAPHGDSTVNDVVTNLIATIGENMMVRRAARFAVDQGVVSAYVHNATTPELGRIGVLVALNSAASDRAALNDLGRKIGMHIAATQPQSLTTDDLDPAAVERERAIFTEQAKPYEVELCVAEVAHFGESKPPELYRITYDGSIADEPHFVVMGGTTEPIITALKESYSENAELGEAVCAALLTAGAADPANRQVVLEDAFWALHALMKAPAEMTRERVLQFSGVMLLSLEFFMLMAAMIGSFRLILAGRELSLHLSSPLPFERVLWMRVVALVATTWAISILLVTPVANMGALLGEPVFLLAYPVTVMMAMLTLALALGVMAAVVRGVGIIRARRVLQVVQEVQRRLHADEANVALVRDLVPGLAQWFPGHAQNMDALFRNVKSRSEKNPNGSLRVI